MKSELQTPSDFVLQRVEISADRFQGLVDITNSVIEFNVFESIEDIFLTGTLIFLDDSGIASAVNFSGTEKVTVEIKLPNSDGATFTKSFIVSAVKDQVRPNDSSTVIQLLLIEEFGYLSQIKKYSKAYTGTPEEILSKICKDQLNKELTVIGKSAQNTLRVIVPFMTVEQSLKWVLNKASTVNGAPFFLFSTFQSDKLYLVDLEIILKDPSINPDQPYIYSSAFNNKNILSVVNKARVIESIKINYQGDTLNYAKGGYFGSNYSNTELDTNISKNYHHSIVDVYNKFNSEDIIEGAQTKPIVDDLLNLNDRKLQNYDSKFFHQLSFSTFEGVNNYYQDNEFSVTKNRLTSKALLNLLQKESLEVNLPGLTFLVNNSIVGVGTNISISLLTSSVEKETGEAIVDKKLSGAYMIFKKRHLFNKRGNTPRHLVSLKLCRLTQEQ